jgi:hypothetical protein
VAGFDGDVRHLRVCADHEVLRLLVRRQIRIE